MKWLNLSRIFGGKATPAPVAKPRRYTTSILENYNIPRGMPGARITETTQYVATRISADHEPEQFAIRHNRLIHGVTISRRIGVLRRDLMHIKMSNLERALQATYDANVGLHGLTADWDYLSPLPRIETPKPQAA